ncbi:MAG TPA: D-amino acid dehydrogenase [Burkholderiaceae bacterium]|nr:D-amino acid dehydrogenase [Burkholderiaceae bacterium]
MRVAVIGAGIVGVTTAYELAADGHDVTVFERRGSVAEETSFANAGLVAPGYVTPWAAPGMPGKVMRHLLSRHSPVRLSGWPNPSLVLWMWRWWRACSPDCYAINRRRMYGLARYSQQRLRELGETLELDYERRLGCLVLLRTARDLALARSGMELLDAMGVRVSMLDADDCRRIEPALGQAAPLHAGIHLPDDEVGNCRQFAQLLKAHAQRLGADFRFQRRVLRVEPGAEPMIEHQLAGDEDPGDTGEAPPQLDRFDKVVVCAAIGAVHLLRPLGLRLPLAAVYGYSLTAPLRQHEGEEPLGPKGAVMDEKYKVAVSRLGSRVRAAGCAELGGSLQRTSPAAVETLYKVLNDWFPGCGQLAKARHWKGARAMLPDGPPVIGASGIEGVWLNLGHGSSGWALACGSARLLADLLAQRAPAIDPEGLDVCRVSPSRHNRP